MSLQAEGAEQGTHDALGLAPLPRTGTAADFPAHRRWTKAAVGSFVVGVHPGVSYEGEQLRREAFHPSAQHPHERLAAQVRLADGG